MAKAVVYSPLMLLSGTERFLEGLGPLTDVASSTGAELFGMDYWLAIEHRHLGGRQVDLSIVLHIYGLQ